MRQGIFITLNAYTSIFRLKYLSHLSSILTIHKQYFSEIRSGSEWKTVWTRCFIWWNIYFSYSYILLLFEKWLLLLWDSAIILEFEHIHQCKSYHWFYGGELKLSIELYLCFENENQQQQQCLPFCIIFRINSYFFVAVVVFLQIFSCLFPSLHISDWYANLYFQHDWYRNHNINDEKKTNIHTIREKKLQHKKRQIDDDDDIDIENWMKKKKEEKSALIKIITEKKNLTGDHRQK